MVKTVTRRRVSPVAAKFIQFLSMQAQAKDLNTEAGKIRDDLRAHVDQYHTEDEEKGHLLHLLPEPIEFKGQKYLGFQKQRKVSQVFLEDKAEALCQEKGFDLDDYTSRYIDQEKIVRLYAEERLSKEEFDSLTEDNVTWAFVPMKG